MKKIVRQMLCLLMVAALAAGCAGSMTAFADEAVVRLSASVDTSGMKYTGYGSGSYSIFSNVLKRDLTSRQKKIYDRLVKAYKTSSRSSVTLKFAEGTLTDLRRARDAVNNSYFRYSNGLVTGSTIDTYVYKKTRKFAYYRWIIYPVQSRAQRTRSLENKRKLLSIAKSVTRGQKTVKQKVLAINKYVCDKLNYRDNSGTLDLALNTGYSKCTGYASLFMALCEMCNIPCCQVAGDASGGHDWNQVRIGGTWYYIDPTYYDTSGRKSKWLLTKKLWAGRSVWAKIYVINFRQCGYELGI